MNRLLSLALVAVAALATGCATLPPPTGRTETTALSNTADTGIGRRAAPLVDAHPGTSGIHKFPNPHDAFAARVLLAAAAEKTLDAQYFIWSGDEVGLLLWEALYDAAERGVRVRLLLDDANTLGNDATLAALQAHPNIEVRLYNPFLQRGSRGLAYLTDFGRLNRRMHNKSFTVDNQMSVVGGRNIANEYFGAGDGISFADIDVLALGPVVREISREFDVYWNSPSAYLAAEFVGPPAPDAGATLRAKFAEIRADPVAADYLKAVAKANLIEEVQTRTLHFDWTTVQVIHDDPAKTLDQQGRSDVLLFPELLKRMGRPEKAVDIVSPYFVPGEQGAAALAALAQRGIQVRILTNSLAASDESVVHAGYLKHRVKLLKAGVQLYELKPSAIAESDLHAKGRFGAGKVAGLHAKSYQVDRKRIFVGSFNFDQRSANLNTEMGLVIDSEQFAGDLSTMFDSEARMAAYEVRLAPDGESLVWIEHQPSGAEVRYDVDPETSAGKRSWVNFLSNLDIDWLL